ncbi:MAG: ABC transporter permease [Gemmatimonadetes bacterium]|nr:ABC transporter permease [Gemmatimonadota bacterium]NNM06999.1 ABC transporter permease [Gemmatimonadota bacterium]
MNVWEGVFLALTQIRTEKLKSFFSLLGVIIGVMFLLVVVSVVEGMDRYIKEDFASQIFGINTITVSRAPSVQIQAGTREARQWARRRRLTHEDADIIKENLTVPALVAAESDNMGTLEGDNGRKVENVIISAGPPDLLQIRNLVVERGRPFSPQEAERGVAVVILGKRTAEVLFQGLDPLGRSVRIRGFPYRVIGILEEQGSLFGFSLDNRAIAPGLSPIQNVVSPRGFIDNILIRTETPDGLQPAMMEIEAILRTKDGLRPSDPNSFELETAEESLGFWDTISRILFMALPGLVGISLVVGGIVIMNIMLVSVMERTREIGVRKAIGARRRDIVVQVLIESATLSGVGATIGVGIGIALTWLVAALSPLPAALAPKWITLGVGLGVAVGMIAGVYPAARAAKLDPVDALRYE